MSAELTPEMFEDLREKVEALSLAFEAEVLVQEEVIKQARDTAIEFIALSIERQATRLADAGNPLAAELRALVSEIRTGHV